jgi:allophanate hydrolase
LIPSPLGIGTVETASGSRVLGFICEQAGLIGAADITDFGGWRSFLASQSPPDL